MSGIEFFRFEVVFATLFLAQRLEMGRQFFQVERLQIEGAKRNVIVDDCLALAVIQQPVNALSRRGYFAVIFPQILEQGVSVSVHKTSP